MSDHATHRFRTSGRAAGFRPWGPKRILIGAEADVTFPGFPSSAGISIGGISNLTSRGQRTRSAHLEHEAAKAELKALQFSLGSLMWPRVKWWSTRGSRGGSDAAPTGPQASKSVRGVIGHQLNLTKMQL